VTRVLGLPLDDGEEFSCDMTDGHAVMFVHLMSVMVVNFGQSVTRSSIDFSRLIVALLAVNFLPVQHRRLRKNLGHSGWLNCAVGTPHALFTEDAVQVAPEGLIFGRQDNRAHLRRLRRQGHAQERRSKQVVSAISQI
jgi:hypothetical protein